MAVASCGILAAVPFLHAASVLRRRSLVVEAAAFGVAGTLLIVLSGSSGSSQPTTMDAVLGLVAAVVMVVACFRLRSLRNEVRDVLADAPALAAAVAARRRRERARALAEADPALARDLGIGRPDRPGEFDDGGLVDLGTAPADVIAIRCDISPADAERIVAAQGLFSTVDELLVLVEIPVGMWNRIRDRGVVIQS